MAPKSGSPSFSSGPVGGSVTACAPAKKAKGKKKKPAKKPKKSTKQKIKDAKAKKNQPKPAPKPAPPPSDPDEPPNPGAIAPDACDISPYKGLPYRTQRKPMACAEASASMLIESITKKHVSEKTLREKSSKRGPNPQEEKDRAKGNWHGATGYDEKNGTMAGDIPKMLEGEGVTGAKLEFHATADSIDKTIKETGNPVIIRLEKPAHFVIVDGVEVAPDGTKEFRVRDPWYGNDGHGCCQKLDADELKDRFFNQGNDAEVITVPKQPAGT